MYYSSPALILRNRDYKESDRLISVFTQQYGKIGAIAKGVKKTKSSLRACTQPFCYAHLYLRQGKSLDVITQGKILDFFGSCRENIDSTMYLLYILEILDKTLPERQPYPALFAYTVGAIRQIEEEGPNPLWLRYFEAKYILEMGFEPVLERCVVCGRQNDMASDFSIAEGGMLCRHCLPNIKSDLQLSGELLAIVKLLLRADLHMMRRVKVREVTLRQVEYLWEKYLEYHLERRFQLKQALGYLKNLLKEK